MEKFQRNMYYNLQVSLLKFEWIATSHVSNMIKHLHPNASIAFEVQSITHNQDVGVSAGKSCKIEDPFTQGSLRSRRLRAPRHHIWSVEHKFALTYSGVWCLNLTTFHLKLKLLRLHGLKLLALLNDSNVLMAPTIYNNFPYLSIELLENYISLSFPFCLASLRNNVK